MNDSIDKTAGLLLRLIGNALGFGHVVMWFDEHGPCYQWECTIDKGKRCSRVVVPYRSLHQLRREMAGMLAIEVAKTMKGDVRR